MKKIVMAAAAVLVLAGCAETSYGPGDLMPVEAAGRVLYDICDDWSASESSYRRAYSSHEDCIESKATLFAGALEKDRISVTQNGIVLRSQRIAGAIEFQALKIAAERR